MRFASCPLIFFNERDAMKLQRKSTALLLMGSLALAPLAGCESLPGDEKTQGAVIGGAGGAVGGAVLAGEDNRLLGGLIGGALGAAGGYLIGAQVEKNNEKHEDDAVAASERARKDPVTAEQARDARTADVNDDGFVTLDEVVAMEDADLTDEQMIRRLERTNQVFVLSAEHREYLRDHGVSDEVIRAMRTMNQNEIEHIGNDRIGHEPDRGDGVSD
jgi:hypothetical protein